MTMILDFIQQVPTEMLTPCHIYHYPWKEHMFPQKLNIRKIEALPVTSKEIRTATKRNPPLSKVKRYVLKGWSEEIPEALQIYHSKIAELSIEDGCLLWRGWVIIPPSLKGKIKAELHKEHLGNSKMKTLAWNHSLCPRIDKKSELLVKSCPNFVVVKQMPAIAPLHPGSWPIRPWKRVHIDFTGLFMNKSFVILPPPPPPPHP